MTRKKVKLAYIDDNAARKSTFHKRKDGVLKKVNELSTLCGVEACAIIYSPYKEEPDVHPNNDDGVARVLRRFSAMTEEDRTARMANHHDFLRQRIDKANQQLARLRRDNDEKETTRVMFEGLASRDPAALLRGLSLLQLNDLDWLLDRHLRDVDLMLNQLSI